MTSNDSSVEASLHAACPLCTRVITREDRDELQDIVEKHNEQRHDGDDVAQVIGNTSNDLDEFMDGVKEKHGSQVYGELGAHIVEVDPWGLL